MSAPLTAGVSRDVVGESVGNWVAEALGSVPRHLFVPAERRMTAYLDRSVPIGGGRRCPRPSTAARMLDAATELSGRALVVGCGTGYLAACVAAVASEVVAVESDRRLAADAAVALGASPGGNNVILRSSVPVQAALEAAPFDTIFVCGALDRTPRALLRGLTEMGTLVAPVRNGAEVRLYAYQRVTRGHLRRDRGPVELEQLPKVSADEC